jgi:hypothetical protein
MVRTSHRLLALLASTTIAGGVLAVDVPSASAVQVAPVQVVCPDNGTTYPLVVSQSGCSTLQAAITNATVANNPATIELMPGNYCPVTIPYGISDLTLAGVGQAGIDPNSYPTVNGSEAALATIKWTSACSAAPPAATVDLTAGHYYGPDGFGGTTTLTLQNLAVIGSAGGPAAGIKTGAGGTFALRDVLVQNVTGSGVDYEAGNYGSITIQNSALIDDGVGLRIDNSLQANTDVNEVDETTIAADGAGIVAVEGPTHLQNVTVGNNTGAGVDLSAADSRVSAQNSIVAGNGTDCDGGNGTNGTNGTIFGHWEYAGSTSSGYNLTTSACNASSLGTDSYSFAGTLLAPTDLGGPTPAVPTPSAAVGVASEPLCNSTGTDQREVLYSAYQVCDIGAVDSSAAATNANASGAASPSAEAFPTLAQGIADIEPITITNQGGNLLGVASVTVVGTGFSLVDDQCSYRTLLPAATNSCTVDVQFAPTAPTGGYNGSLTLGTADGEVPTSTDQITVGLSGTASGTASLPNPPTHVSLLAADHAINVGWSPAAAQSGNATITGYEVDYATSAAPSAWSVSTTGTDPNESSNVVTGLTDGTAYFVRVGAISSIGTTWSTVAGPAVPARALDVTAWSAPTSQSVRYGTKATIHAALTDSSTQHPVGSTAVTLRSRPGHSGAFTALHTMVTTGAGVARLVVKPTRTTEYEWVYAGDGSRRSSTSAVATVEVAQTVTAAVANKRVARRSKVQVYGTVSPAATGKSVRLQEKVAGKWKTVGAAARIHKQKLPNHKVKVGYVLRLRAAKKGRLTLRVTRAATPTCIAGMSSTVTVTVR